MKWKAIFKKLESMEHAIDDIGEAKTEVEGFVRIQLANDLANMQNIVSALAADEEAQQSTAGSQVRGS